MESDPKRMRTRLQAINWRRVTTRLAVISAVGMYLVYALGTVVTNTNSGQGCGRTWPLCRGKFVPEFAVKTAIEYTHRVATGLEGVLILVVAVLGLMFWRQRRELRWLLPATVIFLVIEAVLGGIIAQIPKQPFVLAVHFGSSLILLVTVVLSAVVLYESDGRDRVRDRPLPRGFAPAVWGLIALTYLVGYIGAYVGHLGIGLACSSWPLCRPGTLVPSLAGTTGLDIAINLLHRFSAALLVLSTLGVFLWARRLRRGRPDLAFASTVALVTLALQALAGAYLVYAQLNLVSRLIHASLVALYFIALSYMALHLLPRPAEFRTKIVPRAPAGARAKAAPGSATVEGAQPSEREVEVVSLVEGGEA